MEIEQFINENLLFGRALIDLEVSNKGSNPLWTGFVATNIGEMPAYIKQCRNPEGLCIEVISSLLGLWFNIPIPKPIIVLVEPNHPQITVAQTSYLFGSQMYEMPSFERFLRDSDLNEDCILEYPNLSSIITFDELIGNPDRNNSNILYDGESFRFIDHEKAFHPQQNPRLPINEMHKIGNISDIIKHYKGGNNVYIHRLMVKIKNLLQDEITATDCDHLLFKSQKNTLLTDYNILLDRIRSFLTARLESLALLIENAITDPDDSPQLDFLGN